jgi:hypothetical protein
VVSTYQVDDLRARHAALEAQLDAEITRLTDAMAEIETLLASCGEMEVQSVREAAEAETLPAEDLTPKLP